MYFLRHSQHSTVRCATFISILVVFAITGCLSQPHKSCSHLITAPELGTRQSILTESGHSSIVRLNGVSASCVAQDDMLAIDISAGLKARRDLSHNLETDFLEVPIIFIKIDKDEEIIGYESVSYRMVFSRTTDIIYPVVEFDVLVPDGGRVVLSLMPEPVYL